MFPTPAKAAGPYLPRWTNRRPRRCSARRSISRFLIARRRGSSPIACFPPCATNSAAMWSARLEGKPSERRPAGRRREGRRGRQRGTPGQTRRPLRHVVIFGSSGDLTKRKLIPSLYHLAQKKLLPKEFALVGCAIEKRFPRTNSCQAGARRSHREFAQAPEQCSFCVLDCGTDLLFFRRLPRCQLLPKSEADTGRHRQQARNGRQLISTTRLRAPALAGRGWWGIWAMPGSPRRRRGNGAAS